MWLVCPWHARCRTCRTQLLRPPPRASPGYCAQQRTHTQPRLTHGPRPFPLQRWDPGRHPACADRDVHVHADPVEAGGVGAGYVQGSETDGLLLLNSLLTMFMLTQGKRAVAELFPPAACKDGACLAQPSMHLRPAWGRSHALAPKLTFWLPPPLQATTMIPPMPTA